MSLSLALTRRRTLLGVATMAAAARLPAFAAEPNLLTRLMAGTAVPGMAAILIRNFQPEPEIVAGIRRLGSPAPIAPGDRWHLGSDGKALTATMIARLAERGALSWQARLEQLLPELAPSMHASYRDVTLPDLLSHRAGLPENAADTDFLITFVTDKAPLSEQRRRYITRALAEAPVMEKRTKHSYSNTGFIVAAAVAERATGRDYETLMRTEIFEPLEMRSVTYEAYGAMNEPIGHVDKRIADQPYDPNPPVLSASDGCRLSLADWARFCIDQMRGEHGQGRLLKPESYRFLHTRQGETPFALGWLQQASVYKRRGPAIYHSGSNGNWMAQAVLFPAIGDGVLVTANAAYSMGGNTVSDMAVREFAATLSEPAEA